MAALEPFVRGRLASHPAAPAFVREVVRIHKRYATEVVQAFGLCPFVRDVDVAFGRFVVMLDSDPDLDATQRTVLEAQSPVLHVIFPCALPPPNVFERFASALYTALRGHLSPPAVMAAFHPGLAGDPGAPHRLIGLLRRAPDPFVQLIPEGLHEGGTVFAGAMSDGPNAELDAWGSGSPDGALRPKPLPDHAERTFQRLQGGALERLLAAAADIREDRDKSYAPLLAALG
jgi:hypothetical protein